MKPCRLLRPSCSPKFVSVPGTKTCSNCELVKLAPAEFNINRSRPDGLSSWCRACNTARYERIKSQSKTPPSEKPCSVCQQVKKTDAFSKSSRAVSGLFSQCRDCRKKTRKNGAPKRKHALFHNYRMRPGDYEAMLEKQNGVCAICGSSDVANVSRKHFHIDHCHKTGVVRGLLCGRCNVMLGMSKDSPKVLLKAALYLEIPRV